MVSDPQTTPAWRRWLARKLDPDLYRRAERGWYFERQLDDLHWWCAEFPILHDATCWLRATVQSHFRPLGSPPSPMAEPISDLRERLRRAYVNQ